ncbi:phd zinc finger-containing protein-related [Anaeramoeba flamelloides]|uniref:Phd zinc finger-containing protein-related n=1 Tax=Anaeramoeba flamelloides TaxID=1746091 RepID=A0ABQ8X5T1_9EUKA|nr:phd zinc finger-containing protein-related [Anaeramoeba flamelloides]
MTTNYFQLVWDFGNFLFSNIKYEQLFTLDHYSKLFLERKQQQQKQQNETSTSFRRNLKRIQKLFIQNGVVFNPQKKKKSKRNTTFEKYFLSASWSNVFQSQEEKKQANENSEFTLKMENSRSNRTIGVLGFKLLKLLKEKPLTSEALTNLTQFSKQRVCTVLSIYKLLSLVTLDQETNLYSWNEEQACVLPEIKKYFDDLVAARNARRLLAQKVLMLTERLSKKIAHKHSYDSRYEMISQGIRTTVARNVSCCATKVTTNSSSLENRKTQELLTKLEERKKELGEFRQRRVILDSDELKKYLYYSSSLLSNTKIILRGKRAIILKKRSKKSPKKSKKFCLQNNQQAQQKQQQKAGPNSSKQLSFTPKKRKISDRKRSFKKIEVSIKPAKSTKSYRIIFPILKKKKSFLIDSNFSKKNSLGREDFLNVPQKTEPNKEEQGNVVDEEVFGIQRPNNNRANYQQQDQQQQEEEEEEEEQNLKKTTVFLNSSNISSPCNVNEYDLNSSTFLLGSDNIETYSSPYFDEGDNFDSSTHSLLSTHYDNTELEIPGLFSLWDSETLSIPDKFYNYGEW